MGAPGDLAKLLRAKRFAASQPARFPTIAPEDLRATLSELADKLSGKEIPAVAIRMPDADPEVGRLAAARLADRVQRDTGLRAKTFEHYGDAGAAEYAGRMGAGRGTGHFGTGTYMLASPRERGYLGREGLSIVTSPEVNFLERGSDNLQELHDKVLRPLNNYASTLRRPLDVDKAMRAIEDFDYGWALRGTPEGDVARSMHMLPYQMPGPFADRRDAVEQWFRALNEHIKAREGAGGRFDTGTARDSASTRFLKSLGYEGVSTRLAPELDNTMYGSVLYRPGKFAQGGLARVAAALDAGALNRQIMDPKAVRETISPADWYSYRRDVLRAKKKGGLVQMQEHHRRAA